MYIVIKLPFLAAQNAWVLVAVLFVLMIVFINLGKYSGRRRKKNDSFQENAANSTIQNSVFALLAFILAFTFGMSAARFDARRVAIINEANAIGTAILRADMYPDSNRLIMRKYFENYLKSKIKYIEADADLNKIEIAEKDMVYYQQLLWQYATAFSKKSTSIVISSQMIPALNAMFDAASTTRNSELLRVPQSIVIMLFALSMIAAFFLGYISVGKGSFDWFTGIGFCILISLVVFITLDLDRPRRGLIHLDSEWHSILSLQSQFEKDK